MGLFRPTVRMAIAAVDRLRHQFLPGNAVTARLVGRDLPGVRVVGPEQSSAESPGRLGVPSHLQVHIDDVAVLIHRRPQVVPSPRNRDEHLVDE
jgi:hypothetical protein